MAPDCIRTFATVPQGQPIPYKVWMQATDVLADYVRDGIDFVAAGRPGTGPISEEFAKREREYSRMADAIWFARWTPDQREEWSRICRNGEER